MELIPLFPLHTVLFPGGMLPLRVFEARYLDMVSKCLQSDSPFGVCLITEGAEVGAAARCHAVGTAAHIVDWDRRADGLLGITVRGGNRFRIHSRTATPAGLLTGEVAWLPEEDVSIPARHALLKDALLQVLSEGGAGEEGRDGAGWLAWRLAEMLPFELADKQQILELEDHAERLDRIRALLDAAGALRAAPG